MRIRKIGDDVSDRARRGKDRKSAAVLECLAWHGSYSRASQVPAAALLAVPVSTRRDESVQKGRKHRNLVKCQRCRRGTVMLF